MTIAREFWTAILQKLDEKPSEICFRLDDLLPDEPYESIIDNLKYLKGHGYVENTYRNREISPFEKITATRITSEGHDYIAQDGGITAEKSVNVKLHGETLSVLLAAIDASKETPDMKGKMKKALADLPGNLAVTVATAAIGAVIENIKQQLGL